MFHSYTPWKYQKPLFISYFFINVTLEWNGLIKYKALQIYVKKVCFSWNWTGDKWFWYLWCVARFAKITKLCNFTKINIPPWVFFTFFKLYKWYQIAQHITNGSRHNAPGTKSRNTTQMVQARRTGYGRYGSRRTRVFSLSRRF